jgi:hypothetical protein
MVTNDETQTRGILSKSDRKYLRDPDAFADEHSRAAVAGRQEAVRDRTRQALQDFEVLTKHLSEDARREIIPVSRQDERWGDVYDGFVEMIAFIHLGVASEAELERIIADGVRRAELRRGAVDNELQVAVDCELDVKLSPGVGLEDVADRLDAGEYDKIPAGAGIAFLKALVVAGVLDPHDALEEFEVIRGRMSDRH